MMQLSSPLFQLKVVVSGRPIQEYRGPDNTMFVEGREGSNFELELNNLTGRRLLVHPTVDGLSCMNGKLASKNDNKHGYVLPPFMSIRVPGWRLDDEEVAQFFFAGSGKSYAEKTGRGEDKGVIACAVWEEKAWVTVNGIWQRGLPNANNDLTFDTSQLRYTIPELTVEPHANINYGSGGEEPTMRGFTCSSRINPETASGGSQIGCPRTQNLTQNLGTGYGKRTEHQVYKVSFETATAEPQCLAVVYYDDRRGLRARGIKVPVEDGYFKALPNPFPKDEPQSVGCPPPPGYNDLMAALEAPITEAVRKLAEMRLPVDHLVLPEHLRNRLPKKVVRHMRIFGMLFAFEDGNTIRAVSGRPYEIHEKCVDCPSV